MVVDKDHDRLWVRRRRVKAWEEGIVDDEKMGWDPRRWMVLYNKGLRFWKIGGRDQTAQPDQNDFVWTRVTGPTGIRN